MNIWKNNQLDETALKYLHCTLQTPANESQTKHSSGQGELAFIICFISLNLSTFAKKNSDLLAHSAKHNIQEYTCKKCKVHSQDMSWCDYQIKDM